MKTEFFVEYNLYDTTALRDAREMSESNSAFANLALLKDNVAAPDYGTLEHNFFVLDGSRQEFPDHPSDLAYFSSGQSDAAGLFSEEQSITVRFTESHTSVGLTLTFLDYYPIELEILWYDVDGLLKEKRSFYPDDLICFCPLQVEDYWKVKIIFKKALPYHNVKLQYIRYGTKITWGNDTIKAAKLINDTDPIGDKIATDKLDFDLIDIKDNFNIGNSSGLHKTFQKKQSMLPYEVVNGETIPLGVFFLESNKTTKNVCKMSAVDYKGMLSNVDFREGRIYNGDNAGGVIDEIMAAAGITEYEVDEETAGTPLYGTLKIQTCQKALREVLFACGSIINTSHRIGIEIHKSIREVTADIPRSRKFSTTYETDHYISDVNVKYATWTLDSKVSELTKGTYGAGTHTIQLDNPAANIKTNVGRILKQMPYYVTLEIAEETRSEVVISGQKYVKEELSVLSSIKNIKAGEVRNTKTFTGTLLNFESAQEAADKILDYYQLQQIIKTRHLALQEKSGDWVDIQNSVRRYGNFIAAIESMTTDLAGGFIATATCRGYYKLLTDYYFTGEIYAGEDIGSL